MMDDAKALPTSRITDDSGATTLCVSRLAVDVVSFTAIGTHNGDPRAFIPHATIKVDGFPLPCLVVGLDSILLFLDALYPNEPLSPYRESIADMMEYGQEPWIYHFRDLVKEGTANRLLIKTEDYRDFTPSGEVFLGVKLLGIGTYWPTQ